jgi:hypothetical protein
VGHYLLWKLNGLVTESDIAQAIRDLKVIVPRREREEVRHSGGSEKERGVDADVNVDAEGGAEADAEGGAEADADADTNAFEVVDYAVYINPPELKSIPEIEHAHIVVQLRRKMRQSVGVGNGDVV